MKVSLLDDIYTVLRASTSRNNLTLKITLTIKLSGDTLITFLLDNRVSSKGSRMINIT